MNDPHPTAIPRGCMDELVIAVVMFDGAEEQDSTTFASRKGSWPNLFTDAPTTDVYRMSSGMRFTPDYSYADAPCPDPQVPCPSAPLCRVRPDAFE